MNFQTPSHATTDQDVVLTNATLVLPDEIVRGHIHLRDGMIADISQGVAPTSGLNVEGAYVLPGLVDIHTDHFEKHILPRAHVRWDAVRAALSHDAQIIGAGITTVFDSLAVGSVQKDVVRREILAPMIDALMSTQQAGMLKAEHLLHLRCEITGRDTADLIAPFLDRDIVRLLSVMEHLPGRRQSRDVSLWIERHMKEFEVSRKEAEQELERLSASFDEVIAEVRPKIIDLARRHNLPVMSHDDTEPGHIPEALADGIRISEFPCTLEAARLARASGMLNVGGAPNVLRGGSQSGNVAVADLMRENLIDILASDYVPRSLLDAAFMIGFSDEFPEDLPRAVSMVTRTPAQATGLTDRGELTPGKRADVLLVDRLEDHPVLRAVWRQGRRVA